MSLTLSIERPDAEDIKALIELSDGYMNALYPPEGNFAVDIEALCQNDISFVVARLGQKAAGCGAIKWHTDGSAELKRIFVSDDARGHGIGRKIINFLETLVQQHKVKQLYLETGPLNIEAVSMYKAFGYQECGPFAEYNANPYSLFMKKTLRQNVEGGI